MQDPSPPRVVSPLWVISLFLGLSEVAVTIAVMQAQGWIQGMLAIFAIAFPSLVAIVFFLILWHNNKVLYAPREFADGTTVRDFSEAMAKRTRREVGIVESAIRKSSESLAEQLSELGADDAARAEIIETVVTAARRTTVRVDVSRIADADYGIDIPVDDTTTVQDLLDTIYFAISDNVSPFTYGTHWFLYDAESGLVIDTIDVASRRKVGDNRPLGAVNIQPGTQLIANVRPPA